MNERVTHGELSRQIEEIMRKLDEFTQMAVERGERLKVVEIEARAIRKDFNDSLAREESMRHVRAVQTETIALLEKSVWQLNQSFGAMKQSMDQLTVETRQTRESIQKWLASGLGRLGRLDEDDLK